MHLDRKSNSTIIDVKPQLARSLICSTMGVKGSGSLGTSTQQSRFSVGASIGSTRRS
jgi:hypothetical protein